MQIVDVNKTMKTHSMKSANKAIVNMKTNDEDV
jgi:hypothetical protein